MSCFLFPFSPLPTLTSLQVMRGNLREDVLWQIQDIFVSKSMLKHHSLDKYITVLARIPV